MAVPSHKSFSSGTYAFALGCLYPTIRWDNLLGGRASFLVSAIPRNLTVKAVIHIMKTVLCRYSNYVLTNNEFPAFPNLVMSATRLPNFTLLRQPLLTFQIIWDNFIWSYREFQRTTLWAASPYFS